MTPSWSPPPLSRWHGWLPAVLLGVGTVAVWTLDLDRRVAALYYDPAGPPAWPLGYDQPWDFLYTWGVVPAMAVAVAGMALLAGGYVRAAAWQRWAGGLILLSLILGPLLLTNGVFHELWGRPRPRQVTEFGGDRTFRPVLLPTFHRDEPGFPTGHAAGGFSVMIAYFALRPRSRRWAGVVLALGLGLGGITAWARIAQGGHFLSDGLWAAGVIWFSSLAVERGLARWWVAHPPDGRRPSAARRFAAWALAGVGALALLTGYAAFLPIQERSEWRVPLPAGTQSVQAIVATPGGVRLWEAPGSTEVRIFTTLSGRGWPWAALWERRAGPVRVGDALRLHYTVQGMGMRRSGNVSVVLVAPPGLPVTVEQVDLTAPTRTPPAKAAN